MTRSNQLHHEFVNYIPDALDEGVLYVSIPFATIMHLCCCRCGNEVVTPLDPNDWQMTFDGRSVSLSPSIGNWSLTCKSHYWIYRNQVQWVRRPLFFGSTMRQTLSRLRKPLNFGNKQLPLRRYLTKWFRRLAGRTVT